MTLTKEYILPKMFERSKRDINEIIVHCTATGEGSPVSVDKIRRWHKLRGWRDIGYHFVIHLNGSISAGRHVDEVGAHVKGHNSNSIGVVYVGGLDDEGEPKDTRTPMQDTALVYLLKLLKHQYPEATIHGHNEFANKACPCFDVQKEYGWIE